MARGLAVIRVAFGVALSLCCNAGPMAEPPASRPAGWSPGPGQIRP